MLPLRSTATARGPFFFHHTDDEPVPAVPGPLATLRPEAKGECSFLHHGDREDARLVIRFHDDAGKRWQVDHYMHLELAPDDEW